MISRVRDRWVGCNLLGTIVYQLATGPAQRDGTGCTHGSARHQGSHVALFGSSETVDLVEVVEIGVEVVNDFLRMIRRSSDGCKLEMYLDCANNCDVGATGTDWSGPLHVPNRVWKTFAGSCSHD